MLKRLHVRNFTVFADAEFEFSPGLNIIVGTNGTGKSHVLKLGYAILSTFVNQLREAKEEFDLEERQRNSGKPILSLRKKQSWFLSDKIGGVFRPENNRLDELISRNTDDQEAVIEYQVAHPHVHPGTFIIEEDSNLETSAGIEVFALPEVNGKFAAPVSIPAKEVLTLGWMLQAWRQFKIPMDETYFDLLTQLAGLSLQQPESAAQTAIDKLTGLLGGKIEEQNGTYFLVYPKQQRMEVNLAAEGMRKFGTLQKLLGNGSLTTRSTLYWDEPEANLNPALIRELARLLTLLADQGFQIILATHSLFLLKELHILSRRAQAKPVRYFGLFTGPEGNTQVETTDDFELLQHITALDAELTQTFDYEATLDEQAADDADDTRG